ncbi:MAG: ABC transporter ATP-binding protein [Chloroflexota bacterium]
MTLNPLDEELKKIITGKGEVTQSGSNPAIEVAGLTKFFGHRAALRGIDLKVAGGESVAIFGPNGAGKTTLIKVLATLIRPSSGKISIDGMDLKEKTEEIRRRIGVVSHQTFLYGTLTAYENLEFYARMYDVPGYKERVHEVAAMLGMTSRLYDRVGTLSRGMQQRVAIARSLLHNPSIILLDEAETGLDQQAISILWQVLGKEGGEGRTALLTTHNLERGLELCDRFLILVQGKIVYEGLRRTLDLADLKQAYQYYTKAGA